MEPWWMKTDGTTEGQPRLPAVAYYRHSAQIGQENSVEIQQDNVQSFASKHDLDIIHEFSDRGKSGLNAEGRPAFNEMMDWVRTRDDFVIILVLDVSRWGRFQDTDLFRCPTVDATKSWVTWLCRVSWCPNVGCDCPQPATPESRCKPTTALT